MNDGTQNPYLIPGHEFAPSSPLDPLRHPEHAGLYVDVGGAESAFQYFVSVMEVADVPRSRGRLVVATGAHRCGKTSLVNRCAAWLSQDLRARGVEPLVLDVRAARSPTLPIETRKRLVLDYLLDDLRARSFDPPPDLYRADMDLVRAYHYLAREIPENQVFVILLPASDVVAENELYANLARSSKLVFFAEFEDVPPPGSLADDVVALEVGPLSVEDGWRFVQARQSRGLSAPVVREETVRRILQGLRPSIGMLQRLMFGVYQDTALREERGYDEITYGDVADFYFRISFQGNQLS